MIKEITLKRENFRFPDNHWWYVDIRKFIDENQLHNMEARKTACELANEKPDGMLSIFFGAGVTQEYIDELYERGGRYLECKPNIVENVAVTNEPSIKTGFGVFKSGINDENWVNIEKEQLFLIHIDGTSYEKNGQGGVDATVPCIYSEREPFQQCSQLESKIDEEMLSNLTRMVNLLHGHKTDKNKPSDLDMPSRLLKWAYNNKPELTKKGSRYVNVVLPSNDLLLSGYPVSLHVSSFLFRKNMYADNAYLLVSLDTQTSMWSFYV